MRPHEIEAVPPRGSKSGEEQPTGITCPDCYGAITARVEDGQRFTFRCRIGHLYGTEEMIAAKEQRVENLLWTAISALEELSAFLRDTGVDPDRARRAHEDAAALRRLLDQMDPAQIEVP